MLRNSRNPSRVSNKHMIKIRTTKCMPNINNRLLLRVRVRLQISQTQVNMISTPSNTPNIKHTQDSKVMALISILATSSNRINGSNQAIRPHRRQMHTVAGLTEGDRVPVMEEDQVETMGLRAGTTNLMIAAMVVEEEDMIEEVVVAIAMAEAEVDMNEVAVEGVTVAADEVVDPMEADPAEGGEVATIQGLLHRSQLIPSRCLDSRQIRQFRISLTTLAPSGFSRKTSELGKSV